MQNDFLPSPGFIPSGHRLRQEMVKAINYVETVASLKGGTTEQAVTLTAFLTACASAIASLRDLVAPVYASSLISNTARTRLHLTLSEPLDPGFVPAVGSFVSNPARTFSSVEIVGSTVILTATAAYVAGATTIAYTAPGSNQLRDLSGNLVANITAQTVTNGIV